MRQQIYIEQGIYDLIEVSEPHSGALKLADKIIALDKPTGVVELEQPSSFYFPLFHHLYEEYKLVLNDSELHEIYLICSKLRVKEL